jgi:FlaA1/EpsC-like NDP-sugar epimerase
VNSAGLEILQERLKYYASRWQVILFDALMVVVAWFSSYWIYFNLGTIPQKYFDHAVTILPLVVLCHSAMSIGFAVPRGAWRFTSTHDIYPIIMSVFGGIAVSGFVGFLLTRLEFIPRVVFLVYGVLLIGLLSSSRLLYRSYHTPRLQSGSGKRVLIIGGGVAGNMLVIDLKNSTPLLYKPVGILDDNPKLKGSHIQGIRVLGTCSSLPQLTQGLRIEQVLIAMPSATTEEMSRIVDYCLDADIPYLTLPKVQEILDGAARSRDLRPVALDDLLGRNPISLDIDLISSSLRNMNVLITGAGGSIGSELCRQVVQLNPASLILLEQNEFNLYTIAQEIDSMQCDIPLHARLGDVCDETGVRLVFAEYEPDIVFHAAAYKHVPSLQGQLREAVRNNLVGTEVMARVSCESGCKQFVLISTDKAVNPTSIMGATKRMAEILVQALNVDSEVAFITVRFGNVLGSAGSVVPLFKKQIEAGGPVTVTHPDVTRFFMTIAEACQLIMQASAIGQGSEIFVLDMGSPVSIDFLARQYIRMAGSVPGRDIEIVYTGLRPGEKLTEELFHDDEKLSETVHHQINLAESRILDRGVVMTDISSLLSKCEQSDTDGIEQVMKKLVPEYTPENNVLDVK